MNNIIRVYFPTTVNKKYICLAVRPEGALSFCLSLDSDTGYPLEVYYKQSTYIFLIRFLKNSRIFLKGKNN